MFKLNTLLFLTSPLPHPQALPFQPLITQKQLWFGGETPAPYAGGTRFEFTPR